MRAAILAGGKASRFDGRPKGLEKVGGERIVDRVAQAVQLATGAPPVLIANAQDAGSWRPDLEVIPDTRPDCGALGGIYTAVASGDEPVLVVAWDMPFVSQELLAALTEGLGDHDAFLPESDGPLGVEPLCAVYGPGCAGPILRRLDDEDYRATAFHEDVRIGTLAADALTPLGDPAVLFFNVNTAADLTRADEIWRTQQGGAA